MGNNDCGALDSNGGPISAGCGIASGFCPPTAQDLSGVVIHNNSTNTQVTFDGNLNHFHACGSASLENTGQNQVGGVHNTVGQRVYVFASNPQADVTGLQQNMN